MGSWKGMMLLVSSFDTNGTVIAWSRQISSKLNMHAAVSSLGSKLISTACNKHALLEESSLATTGLPTGLSQKSHMSISMQA